MGRRAVPRLAAEPAPAMEGSDSTRPLADASTTPLARPLSPRYHVLLTRSIFSRDKSIGPLASAPDGGGGPGHAAAAKTTLAFRGAAMQGTDFTAFFEDVSGGGGVKRVKEGEKLASGFVRRVTIDAIDYETNGHTTRVAIGQNLAGAAVPMPTTAPAAPRPRRQWAGWRGCFQGQGRPRPQREAAGPRQPRRGQSCGRGRPGVGDRGENRRRVSVVSPLSKGGPIAWVAGQASSGRPPGQRRSGSSGRVSS